MYTYVRFFMVNGDAFRAWIIDCTETKWQRKPKARCAYATETSFSEIWDKKRKSVD